MHTKRRGSKAYKNLLRTKYSSLTVLCAHLERMISTLPVCVVNTMLKFQGIFSSVRQVKSPGAATTLTFALALPRNKFTFWSQTSTKTRRQAERLDRRSPTRPDYGIELCGCGSRTDGVNLDKLRRRKRRTGVRMLVVQIEHNSRTERDGEREALSTWPVDRPRFRMSTWVRWQPSIQRFKRNNFS